MNVSKYRDLYIHLQFILYTVAPLEIRYNVYGPGGTSGGPGTGMVEAWIPWGPPIFRIRDTFGP